jgi:hypothetical protein
MIHYDDDDDYYYDDDDDDDDDDDEKGHKHKHLRSLLGRIWASVFILIVWSVISTSAQLLSTTKIHDRIIDHC